MNKRVSIFAGVLASMLIAAPIFAHEHKPPHSGTLVEFGEEFAHLELVLDAATGTLKAYALDGEAEKAVLTDPQTSGGLLVACAPSTCDEILAIFPAFYKAEK